MSNTAMTTEEFDKAFDEGSDEIDTVMDWENGRRPALEIKRVNVGFPAWMLKVLDRQAAELGIAREAVIKTWIAKEIKAQELEPPVFIIE